MIPLTPAEAFNLVVLAVEREIDKGICWRCALIVASAVTGVHRDRVEDIWIDHQTRGLDQP